MSTNPYLGPKTASAEQLDAAVALANSIFRAGRPGNMGRQFPLMFHPDRLDQLRIFEDDTGEVVSMAGTVTSDVAMLGCSTRMACIGSVCTVESARGIGLAGRLVEDSIARSAAAGISAILVSGHRSLYLRRGWAAAGRFARYTIGVDALPAGDAGIEIPAATPRDCRAALKLHEREPIAFRRTPADYAAQIDCGWTVDRAGKTFLVAGPHGGAVVSANLTWPKEDGQRPVVGVAEMAGSRQAMLASLRRIVEAFCCEADEVVIEGYLWDIELRELCAALGVEAETVRHLGAVKIIDAARLWEDFAPLRRERMGEAGRRIALRVQADALAIESLTFELDGEKVTIRGNDQAVATMFGSADPDPLAGQAGPLAELLRRVLPLPLPLYGLNYA